MVVANAGESRPSPLRDGPVLWLCGLIALSCGTVRSLLDALLPLVLRNWHGFGVQAISNAMLAAALLFVVGSTGAGFLLAQRPKSAQPVLAVSSFAASLVTATVLLPATGAGVSLLFCLYFLLSSVIGVAVTSALEDRGKVLGNIDNVMALQVFFWTLGFAGGGLLSVVANGGTGSPARQRLTLGILGGVNLLFTAFFVAFGGGKGAGGKGEDEMKIA